MATTDDGVRALTRSDLDWVLDLGSARRERIVHHAPRFWRPAPDARTVHAPFLGQQIDNPDVLTIRTDHGFLFGAARGDLLVVDDMALDDEAWWASDGQRLLRRAAETADVRFVCPVPEAARTHTAVALGMTVAETWWHRDLPAPASTEPRDEPSISVDGAAGRLVPAPPVYDPGGPVLLVFDVRTTEALAAIEDEAARAGAVVSVVTQRPGNDRLVELLISADYVRTTDFFEWRRATVPEPTT